METRGLADAISGDALRLDGGTRTGQDGPVAACDRSEPGGGKSPPKDYESRRRPAGGWALNRAVRSSREIRKASTRPHSWQDSRLLSGKYSARAPTGIGLPQWQRPG